ncbi:FAD-dependent oxidoreductase [Marinimicrobium sp. C6131]|uniref:ferredoxin--NADP reductase n=1 Tax=Marinimicrobium sp. C6131 TaxID=3022676 RepID=UPI00223E4652|nr:FAD-dependent oxidoreductase [Marinimicrobium sp. C6131]UZJ44450.1 FAD-dependent oxidoreductase [Marinimicrobium sp. C6131]
MTSYTVKLKQAREVAEETLALHLEKPEGFTFKPGQFVECKLIDPPETDEEGSGRAFSLANAPHEPDLMVATRLRDSAFKRVLQSLKPGATLELEGPFGSFVLHNKTQTPAVFLTGGIGITPVRSIILDALHRRLAHRILLFYANRRPEDAAFLEELNSPRDTDPHYTFIPLMTQADQSSSDWRGETGRINRALLEKYLDDLTAPIYYLDGPAGMVNAMRQLLNEAGVDDDNIRAEEFSGY